MVISIKMFGKAKQSASKNCLLIGRTCVFLFDGDPSTHRTWLSGNCHSLSLGELVYFFLTESHQRIELGYREIVTASHWANLCISFGGESSPHRTWLSGNCHSRLIGRLLMQSYDVLVPEGEDGEAVSNDKNFWAAAKNLKISKIQNMSYLDLLYFADKQQLSGDTINYYLTYLCAKHHNATFIPTYAFQLNQFDTQIADKRFLLAPIHLTNHWALAIVDFKEKTIDVYDSFITLRKPKTVFLANLMNIIFDMAVKTNADIGDRDDWSDPEEILDAVQQNNGVDCGVHCLVNAYSFLNGKTIRGTGASYTHEHIPYYRRKFFLQLIGANALRINEALKKQQKHPNKKTTAITAITTAKTTAKTTEKTREKTTAITTAKPQGIPYEGTEFYPISRGITLATDKDNDIWAKVEDEDGNVWMTEDLPLNEATEAASYAVGVELLAAGNVIKHVPNRIDQIRGGLERAIHEYSEVKSLRKNASSSNIDQRLKIIETADQKPNDGDLIEGQRNVISAEKSYLEKIREKRKERKKKQAKNKEKE